MDVHNVLAEDDLVVVLATVNAQRKGVSASFPEVHVWRMKDGKASEFREYQGDEQRRTGSGPEALNILPKHITLNVSREARRVYQSALTGRTIPKGLPAQLTGV